VIEFVANTIVSSGAHVAPPGELPSIVATVIGGPPVIATFFMTVRPSKKPTH